MGKHPKFNVNEVHEDNGYCHCSNCEKAVTNARNALLLGTRAALSKSKRFIFSEVSAAHVKMEAGRHVRGLKPRNSY